MFQSPWGCRGRRGRPCGCCASPSRPPVPLFSSILRLHVHGVALEWRKLGRTRQVDERRLAKRASVGLPDWHGSEIPVSTPDSTRVRGDVGAFAPGNRDPCKLRTWSGVLARWLPDIIACCRPSGLFRPRLGTKTVVSMLGWDYDRSGVGT